MNTSGKLGIEFASWPSIRWRAPKRLGISIDEPHPVGDAVAAAHAHTAPVAAEGAADPTPSASGPRCKPIK